MSNSLEWFSVQYQAMKRAFLRFPLPIVLSLVIAGYIFDLIDKNDQYIVMTSYFKIILTLALGLPLFTAIDLFRERNKYDLLRRLGLYVLGVLILASYYFFSFNYFGQYYGHKEVVIRFILLAVLFMMLLSLAPYIFQAELNGFWHFNKSLFLRLVLSLICAGVLQAGLSAALFSMDKLLGVSIDAELYLKLFVFLGVVFNTVFFLAGVPVDFRSLQRERNYPTVLKVFAKYVLFPLALIYIAILYMYLIKILVSSSFPDGWVAMPILVFAAVGIFAQLIAYPLYTQLKERSATIYNRWFYILLLPLIGMLYLAFLRRISEYGITELRYIGMGIGDWLLVMSLYFLFSRKKDIRLIPISLAVFIVVAVGGPWGAFSVSDRSQVGRLEDLLVENGILVNGKVQKVSSQGVPVNVQKEISSILRYLQYSHGFLKIDDWFQINFASFGPEDKAGFRIGSATDIKNDVMTEMGLTYMDEWQMVSSDGSVVDIEQPFYFNSALEAYQPFGALTVAAASVSGFDYVLPFDQYYELVEDRGYEQGTISYVFPDIKDTLSIFFDYKSEKLVLKLDDSSMLQFDMPQFIFTLNRNFPDNLNPGYSRSDIPMEYMTLAAENQQMRVQMLVKRIDGSIKDGKISRFSISVLMLVDMK